MVNLVQPPQRRDRVRQPVIRVAGQLEEQEADQRFRREARPAIGDAGEQRALERDGVEPREHPADDEHHPRAHQHLADGREREIGREAPPPLRVRGDRECSSGRNASAASATNSSGRVTSSMPIASSTGVAPSTRTGCRRPRARELHLGAGLNRRPRRRELPRTR